MVLGSCGKIVTMIVGMNLSCYNTNYEWRLWILVWTLWPFAVNCQTVLYMVVTRNLLVTYIVLLNNVFFHDTNTFYCVTLNFSVENCECSNMPLSGRRVPPGWAALTFRHCASSI
jgi:hypothetical protein